MPAVVKFTQVPYQDLEADPAIQVCFAALDLQTLAPFRRQSELKFLYN